MYRACAKNIEISTIVSVLWTAIDVGVCHVTIDFAGNLNILNGTRENKIIKDDFSKTGLECKKCLKVDENGTENMTRRHNLGYVKNLEML